MTNSYFEFNSITKNDYMLKKDVANRGKSLNVSLTNNGFLYIILYKIKNSTSALAQYKRFMAQ